MKLTAAQAKERILEGNIAGDHEVIEDLDMSHYTIPKWPCWKFKAVSLQGAKITRITGSFTFLDCSTSMLEEIDPLLQVDKSVHGISAYFSHCTRLVKAQGSFAGFSNWNQSGIKEIDPKAVFGAAGDGYCASFVGCQQLSKVQGNFAGCTVWKKSGVAEIDPKTQFGVDKDGDCAEFDDCPQLHKVQGFFPGFTSWKGTPITSIDKNTHFGQNNIGTCALFSDEKIITYAKKPDGIVYGAVVFRPNAPTLRDMEF